MKDLKISKSCYNCSKFYKCKEAQEDYDFYGNNRDSDNLLSARDVVCEQWEPIS